jgi:hypothetical protein
MARASKDILSVLLVEGQTDAIFYGMVKDQYLKANCACKIEPIEGLYNIHNKVLGALKTKNTDRLVRAYCCLDRESRSAQTPEFDLKFIRAELKRDKVENVLSVDQIIATQMIESWFFHDIMGIYKHLKIPKAKRNPKAYKPVERFCEKDLKELFSRYGKVYTKGDRARHFIESLDVKLICSQCKALDEGIALIRDTQRPRK